MVKKVLFAWVCLGLLACSSETKKTSNSVCGDAEVIEPNDSNGGWGSSKCNGGICNNWPSNTILADGIWVCQCKAGTAQYRCSIYTSGEACVKQWLCD